MMRLNREQQRGVDSPGHCLISACPGSGKTRVLVERAKRLLASDPRVKVATITFTKDAANEMSERLVKATDGLSTNRIITGTFHALALKQLNEARDRRVLAGELPAPVKILTEDESLVLMTRAWKAEAPKEDKEKLIMEIEAIKSTCVPPENPNGPLARAFNYYQQLLHEMGACDLADLVSNATNGMYVGDVHPIACTHLLVDEMQDVDQAQYDWLMVHKDRGILLTCVGDDDQSIYGFRSALGYEALRRFADATIAEEITLGTTYRCSAHVMTLAIRLISKNKERIWKSVKTAQQVPGAVFRHDYSDEADEAKAAGLFLNERPIVNGNGNHCTAAILARTNTQLRTAEIMLTSASVPFYTKGPPNFWTGGLPKRITDLLGAYAGQGAHGIIMILHSRKASRDLIRTIHEVCLDNSNPVPLLLTPVWKKNLDNQALQDWSPIAALLSSVRKQLAEMDYEGAIKQVAAMAAAVDRAPKKAAKLAKVVSNILINLQGDVVEKLRAVEWMKRATKEEEHDPRAIALMTLHGSKGLEFDYVWMMGVEHGVLPHKNSPIEEERRLCYVGMTRAKTNLTLSTAVEEGAPSKFFDEMGLESEITFREANW